MQNRLTHLPFEAHESGDLPQIWYAGVEKVDLGLVLAWPQWLSPELPEITLLLSCPIRTKSSAYLLWFRACSWEASIRPIGII